MSRPSKCGSWGKVEIHTRSSSQQSSQPPVGVADAALRQEGLLRASVQKATLVLKAAWTSGHHCFPTGSRLWQLWAFPIGVTDCSSCRGRLYTPRHRLCGIADSNDSPTEPRPDYASPSSRPSLSFNTYHLIDVRRCAWPSKGFGPPSLWQPVFQAQAP